MHYHEENKKFLKQFSTKRVWSKKRINGKFVGIAMEFIIPDEYKLEALSRLSIFKDKYKDLNQKYFDIHQGECFYCRDIKVVFDNQDRWFKLINPFFPEASSSELDWWPVEKDFNPEDFNK